MIARLKKIKFSLKIENKHCRIVYQALYTLYPQKVVKKKSRTGPVC